jgi:eukaryotic-like serine/threonine-protein kinase
MVWSSRPPDAIRSTPFVLNDLVFVGCESGDYYAVDFRGELKWRFHAKRAITSSTLGPDRRIFFTSVDSTLYALDPRNGWVIWRFRLGKPSISTPCIVDDTVSLPALRMGSSMPWMPALPRRSGASVPSTR